MILFEIHQHLKETDDQTLIEHLLKGGSTANEAFTHIYKHAFPKVRNLIIQKGGDAEEAKDIFQDSLLAFHKMVQENRFRKESKIETIIYAIAKNLWLMKIRNRKSFEELSNVSLAIDELPSFEWGQFSLEKIVRDLIGDLSDDCQRIIDDFYYKKHSMTQIKESFGLGSVEAAKNKKYRCVKSLIEIFKERGIEKGTLSR